MIISNESRIVASFTFIVVLMLGAYGSLEAIASQSGFLPSGEVGRVVIASRPLVAAAVAAQATRATDREWARALGGAAVLLGVLATLAGAVYVAARMGY